MKKNTLTNEQLRLKAIELYKSDWHISDICSSLKCSRNWFYKWLKRYKTNDPAWYKERSRAPRTTKSKTDSDKEQLVLDTRKQLISKPYMQYGPQAIYYSLAQQNIMPPPVWTIARILKRHNLTRDKRTTSYISKGKKYPYQYILCQQMDFVGPRYLYSKTRFYFHCLICCDTHHAKVSVIDNQNSDNVCTSLIQFWKVAGIPDYLQMDNDLSFWGSLRKPNAVGKVIRLCLLHGITPVFIPVKEPWRNGIIEHFNRTMQNAVLNSEKLENNKDVQKAVDQFCNTHNETHHYSSQEGMTPTQRMDDLGYPWTRLNEDYKLGEKHLPLEDGEIHIIRFVRSDLKFNMFGLSFLLPEDTRYEYIKGVIITNEHRLLIFKDQQYITDFEFKLY